MWGTRSALTFSSLALSGSLRQRMEAFQRDKHTQWDTTALHAVAPGAGEVTKARRSNKPGGATVPVSLFPSGKVVKSSCKVSNAFTNVMDEDI